MLEHAKKPAYLRKCVFDLAQTSRWEKIRDEVLQLVARREDHDAEHEAHDLHGIQVHGDDDVGRLLISAMGVK